VIPRWYARTDGAISVEIKEHVYVEINIAEREGFISAVAAAQVRSAAGKKPILVSVQLEG
jgi:hypothetical protein